MIIWRPWSLDLCHPAIISGDVAILQILEDGRKGQTLGLTRSQTSAEPVQSGGIEAGLRDLAATQGRKSRKAGIPRWGEGCAKFISDDWAPWGVVFGDRFPSPLRQEVATPSRGV